MKLFSRTEELVFPGGRCLMNAQNNKWKWTHSKAHQFWNSEHLKQRGDTTSFQQGEI